MKTLIKLLMAVILTVSIGLLCSNCSIQYKTYQPQGSEQYFGTVDYLSYSTFTKKSTCDDDCRKITTLYVETHYPDETPLVIRYCGDPAMVNKGDKVWIKNMLYERNKYVVIEITEGKYYKFQMLE